VFQPLFKLFKWYDHLKEPWHLVLGLGFVMITLIGVSSDSNFISYLSAAVLMIVVLPRMYYVMIRTETKNDNSRSV
jgi:hypothetical protein